MQVSRGASGEQGTELGALPCERLVDVSGFTTRSERLT